MLTISKDLLPHVHETLSVCLTLPVTADSEMGHLFAAAETSLLPLRAALTTQLLHGTILKKDEYAVFQAQHKLAVFQAQHNIAVF